MIARILRFCFMSSLVLSFCCLASPLQANSRLMSGDLNKLIVYFDAWYKQAAHKDADFKAFLAEVSNVDDIVNVSETIRQFRQAGFDGTKQCEDVLDTDKCVNIYRLLGVYVRTRYKNEMRDKLKDLVSIDTHKVDEGSPQYRNPRIIEMGGRIEAISRELGLGFVNFKGKGKPTDKPPKDLGLNRIFEVYLDGVREDGFGIYTHSDVVPVDLENWTKIPGIKDHEPFDMQLYQAEGARDRYYGRGTEDDKSSIVSAMYAMKAIRDAGLKPGRKIRLLIETTEETGGEGITFYLNNKRDGLPKHNVVLDSAYPVVTAEKGVGEVDMYFPMDPPPGSGSYISSVTGGTATNQIPAQSLITIKTDKGKELLDPIRQTIDAYRGKYPVPDTLKYPTANYTRQLQLADEFLVTEEEKKDNMWVQERMYRIQDPGVSEDNTSIKVVVQGVSAHSSEPQEAVNPLPRAMGLVDLLRERGVVGENHITDAARLVVEKFGVDFYGQKMGVSFDDPFMGGLTISLTFTKQQVTNPYMKDDPDKYWQITANIRNPKDNRQEDNDTSYSQRGRDRPPEPKRPANWDPTQHDHSYGTVRLENAILASLKEFDLPSGRRVIYRTNIERHMNRNKDAKWIQTMVDIFRDVTGTPDAQPISSAGTTTAKRLPNGVSFGPSYPNEKYRGHVPNEFKIVDHFHQDAQLFTEMILRVSALKNFGEGDVSP